jgi:hypothetical protein
VKKGTILLMTLVISAGGGYRAFAQDEIVPTGFLNVDAGAQPQRQTITASSSFPLYDETATVSVSQRIRNGAVFDVSGGIRIAHNLAAGVGVSQFGRSGTGTVSASIPNPRFYDQPLPVVKDAGDLEHQERAIHARLTWFVPISDSIDVSVSGGPSYIRVVQGVATGVTVVTGTQSVSIANETQSGNAFGANGGVDGNVMLTSGFGIGLWVRYTYGKLDLPDVKGLKVGGLQGGLGFRARF